MQHYPYHRVRQNRGRATLKFFGNISYSLYLIHILVGGRIGGIGSRYVNINNDLSLLVILAVKMALTIGAAYLLYIFVEKPAQKWASSVIFGERKWAKAAGALLARQALRREFDPHEHVAEAAEMA